MTPAPVDPLNNLYVLHFRVGGNPHPMSIHFRFNGDLKSAINRGRVFAEQTGKKFTMVRPFITSLDTEERRYNDMETVDEAINR